MLKEYRALTSKVLPVGRHTHFAMAQDQIRSVLAAHSIGQASGGDDGERSVVVNRGRGGDLKHMMTVPEIMTPHRHRDPPNDVDLGSGGGKECVLEVLTCAALGKELLSKVGCSGCVWREGVGKNGGPRRPHVPRCGRHF